MGTQKVLSLCNSDEEICGGSGDALPMGCVATPPFYEIQPPKTNTTER